MNTIGDRIKQRREALGLSQAQLAKLAKCSQGTIGNLEKGHRENPRNLLDIAKALGVLPDWLASGKGEMYASSTARTTQPVEPTTTDASSVLAQLSKLLCDVPHEHREKVYEAMKNMVMYPDQNKFIVPVLAAIQQLSSVEKITTTAGELSVESSDIYPPVPTHGNKPVKS